SIKLPVGCVRRSVVKAVDPPWRYGWAGSRFLSRPFRAATLSLKSLAAETFIVFGRPHSPSTMQANAVIAACHAAGFSPRVGHVVPNNLSRLNLVAANLGIAIVAASLQRMNIDGVVYRRLKRAEQLK